MEKVFDDLDFEKLFLEMLDKTTKNWLCQPMSRKAISRKLIKCGIRRESTRMKIIGVFESIGLIKFYRKKVFYIEWHKNESVYYTINWDLVSTMTTPIPMWES